MKKTKISSSDVDLSVTDDKEKIKKIYSAIYKNVIHAANFFKNKISSINFFYLLIKMLLVLMLAVLFSKAIAN